MRNLKDIDSRYLLSPIFLSRISKKRGVCDLINSFIATSSVVVKRDIIEKFSEDRDFISVEDLCLWIRLLDKKETKYSYISQKLVKYRVLSKSISDKVKYINRRLEPIYVLSNTYLKEINMSILGATIGLHLSYIFYIF